MIKLFKPAAIAIATSGLAFGAAPAMAATASHAPVSAEIQSGAGEAWNQYRSYNDGYSGRTWRGRDGRYYCRKKNGTTGMIVGGAAGALIGREVGGRNRTLGTIVGAAGGALLGREIQRSGSRRTCR